MAVRASLRRVGSSTRLVLFAVGLLAGICCLVKDAAATFVHIGITQSLPELPPAVRRRATVQNTARANVLLLPLAYFVRSGVQYPEQSLTLCAWRCQRKTKQERSFGCLPAQFSGEDQTLQNVTMVRLEADKPNKDREACNSPGGLTAEEARAKASERGNAEDLARLLRKCPNASKSA